MAGGGDPGLARSLGPFTNKLEPGGRKSMGSWRIFGFSRDAGGGPALPLVEAMRSG
jgi:hypothetical protein